MARTEEDRLPILSRRETQKDMLYVEILIAVIEVIAFLVIAPIIVIPVLPPMLAVYYIALIVQVFRSDVYNKVGEFLGSVAKWLCIFLAVISVDLLLCMLIFEATPSLKHRTFHGLSIARWIGVLAIICVFLTYSMLVRYLLGYRRLQRQEHNEETVHLYEGIIGAINSLFYLLALFSIIRVAPLLKKHKILGHPTQKWVRMIILLVLGHFSVRILTSTIVVSLRNKHNIEAGTERLLCSENSILGQAVKSLSESIKSNASRGLGKFLNVFTDTTGSTERWTKYIVYYAEGLRTSFNFVFTSLLVLLTWILYLGSRLDRSSSRVIGEVYDCGWRTLACVLAGGVLWLVKSGIILTWRARVVYDRFEQKILDAAKQLYFISIIVDPNRDIMGIWKNQKVPDKQSETSTSHRKIEQQSHDEEGKKTEDDRYGKNSKTLDVEHQTAWKILVRKMYCREGEQGILKDRTEEEQNAQEKREDKPRTSDLVVMARYFMAAEGPLSKDDFITRIDAKLREPNSRWREEVKLDKKRIAESLEGVLEADDRNLFIEQLVTDKDKFMDLKSDKDKVTYATYLEKWIMKYRKVRLELGRTISGAMEVVNCLDNIMTGVLVASVFIVWLLLTELATTKVLVLIASPIAGASFIFGQSCSTLFQGIMFAYVMHPFDVGDLCTINQVQLEVKRIGVWKTCFSKVGTTDSVSYPNSVLANILIDNHKVEMDPNDCVELRLKSTSTTEQIKQLKLKIEGYLDEEESFKKHPYGVRLKDIGVDDLTIAVHFKHEESKIKHILPVDGLCKKSEMREKLLVQMKKFLEELDIKNDTNGPPHSSIE